VQLNIRRWPLNKCDLLHTGNDFFWGSARRSQRRPDQHRSVLGDDNVARTGDPLPVPARPGTRKSPAISTSERDRQPGDVASVAQPPEKGGADRAY
jgi:hypothetical protein